MRTKKLRDIEEKERRKRAEKRAARSSGSQEDF